ncbi:hypothetical protein PRIPAC_94409 [Pristionchus pacificus]|uniref:Uncharacterized protein n=1 Tax=Pristionchus pacificus TaxID=54126 RepID=A0A2A6BQ41_PRIPA|nr:hypothetical protein PRIPAC_94409 [Pristionchus pacificus]|eukprot:PDM67988.1 hypothetical protein PRIPAC_46032 [Pristionchus pacificus]
MPSARQFLSSLEKVASLPSTTPVSSSFSSVLSLTLDAFHSDKPLFRSSDKTRAFSALHRCLPLLQKAFTQLDVGMNVDRRIDSQKYRSGLQFIVDEVSEDQTLHNELLNFISSVPIISIEKFIKNTTGCTPDTIVSEKVDVSRIPRSHYWWFYEECDDE